MPERLTKLVFASIALASLAGSVARAASPQPRLEAEEQIYSFEPADNGAGPLWCHGSTCLVRSGNDLFASGLETLPDAKPLNNCRWTLFTRDTNGWRSIPTPDNERTREPSPMAAFADGRFWLSANPTIGTNFEAYSGPAHPELLEFNSRQPGEFKRVEPVWQGTPSFTEHSYRTVAADAEARELILLQNIAYTHAEWSFLDREGKWSVQGQLKWPVENQKPIRLCYPTVAIKNRAVYFCGTSDILEPNEAWNAYKYQLTGKKAGYAFRRLFYTWNTDITTNRFHDWIELASVDPTGGEITLGDLWPAPDGSVHLIWSEQKLDERLRDKFFPEQKQHYSLFHAVLRDGRVVSRHLLLESDESAPSEIPGRARFQVTPENRLFAVFFVSGQDDKGQTFVENRVVELGADGRIGDPVRLPLKHAMFDFFTATTRAGSPPSKTIEMLGQSGDLRNTIIYARVRLD